MAKNKKGSDWHKGFDGQMTEEQHAEYHRGCICFCIRCDIRKRRAVYDACALNHGISWLDWSVRGGLWGLGCRVCARYAASGAKLSDARFSKFANYSIRPISGFQARGLLEQHSRSRGHRVACAGGRTSIIASSARSKPVPVEAVVQVFEECDALTLQDVELLQGNVPSALEWRDAWATFSECLSLRKEARICAKRVELCNMNRRRKRHRQQLVVMAEVLRNHARHALSEATSISLSLDECKYKK